MIITVNNAIILLLIVSSLFLICCIFFILDLRKEHNKRQMIEEFALTASLDSENIAIRSLDALIASTLNEYTYINIECNPNFRITKDTELELTKIIAATVLDNMSKVMYNKLMVVYNKDKLANIISDRVYIQIVPYLTDKLSELE